MRVIATPDEMRAWSRAQRQAGRSVGFVPTMGALHVGHRRLMEIAAARDDAVVLSVFVNPTQFGPDEDLDRYPRTFDADCAMAEEVGVEVTYAPAAATMYPDGYATYVNVERLTQGLCGGSRPHHFRGVTTVVTKLFNAVQPDRAYFGQKDAQQAAVIRRMTRDLDFGIEIVVVPTVREASGLAVSSRNQYLSEDERRRALGLSQGLFAAQALWRAGERSARTLTEAVRERMARSGFAVDYVALVDADEMTPLDAAADRALLAAAGRLGETRLIDNLILDTEGAERPGPDPATRP